MKKIEKLELEIKEQNRNIGLLRAVARTYKRQAEKGEKRIKELEEENEKLKKQSFKKPLD